MSMSMDLLTVATVNYAPQALVTLRSARRCGRYTSYNFFVLDGPAHSVAELRRALGPDADWITLFGPDDITFQRERYLTAFEYYDPFELSCFAKYVAMAHLCGRPSAAELCVYADADILFLSDISDACSDIGSSVALLTPHQIDPASDQDELEHLALGWLNAGFFCVRRGHAKLHDTLNWLIERISRHGFNAPKQGLFVDQVWLSALPCVFPGTVEVSSSPALNVAYWNLEERDISCDGATFLVNGQPLGFFHFSGFEPSRPGLTKHASVLVPAGSALDGLCQLYRKELTQAASISSMVSGLARIPCSRASLAERLGAGARKNGTKPYANSGSNILSRLAKQVKARF
jgi:hypothetical protein